jgi:hypothetical protein
MAPGASWNGLLLFELKAGVRDVDKVFVVDGTLMFCHGAYCRGAEVTFVGGLAAFVPPIMTVTMTAMSSKRARRQTAESIISIARMCRT